MKIKIDTAALGRSKWYEYVVRFVFGGIVTALTGIIAKHWGPEIGGLFLAFPAIFPATATLSRSMNGKRKSKLESKGGFGDEQQRGLTRLEPLWGASVCWRLQLLFGCGSPRARPPSFCALPHWRGSWWRS